MTQPLPKSRWERIGLKLFPNLLMHGKFEKLPLKIHWRRIFIFPTKPGLFFGLVCFLMLMASLNFNNNMGLMMTFLLVGMAQVALHRVFFNLRNLEINEITVKPVFVDEDAEFLVHIQSEEDKFDLVLDHGDSTYSIFELETEKGQNFLTKKLADKRGWMPMGRYKVSTRFPFGLFVSWIWTQSEVKALVYPKPESPLPSFPLNTGGEGDSEVIMKGEEFHGLKPYQTGDSMKLIAWKRTAQVDEPISREFEQQLGQRMVFDFAKIRLPHLEDKISRLTAWVLASHQNGQEYRLLLPGYDSGFGNTVEHSKDCLKALALH